MPLMEKIMTQNDLNTLNQLFKTLDNLNIEVYNDLDNKKLGNEILDIFDKFQNEILEKFPK